jgi:hypothetical protein
VIDSIPSVSVSLGDAIISAYRDLLAAISDGEPQFAMIDPTLEEGEAGESSGPLDQSHVWEELELFGLPAYQASLDWVDRNSLYWPEDDQFVELEVY